MLKITEINGESYLVKYLSSDNLIEIDVLSRLNHPHIIHSIETMKRQDKVITLLPLVNFTLDRAIATYSTEKKLLLLFQLLHALEFIHSNNLAHTSVNKKNIGMKDKHPYFINLDSCVLDKTRQSLDVQDFGKLFLEVLNGSNAELTNQDLFRFVNKEYKTNCLEFVNWIVKESPSSKEVINHKIFDKVRKELIGEVISSPINSDYASDHRDIIKLTVHWCKELFPEKDVELLFLAIDLFNRSASFYKDKPSLERMALGTTCLLMAGKMFGEKLSVTDELKIVNILVSGINEEMITNKELEVIDLLGGILNVSELYKNCNNSEEVKTTFREIVMNKDSTLYAKINVEEWMRMMSVENSSSSKEIKIRDL